MVAVINFYDKPGVCYRKFVALLQNNSVKNIVFITATPTIDLTHGPLTRYIKLRIAHALGMLGTFSTTTDIKGY